MSLLRERVASLQRNFINKKDEFSFVFKNQLEQNFERFMQKRFFEDLYLILHSLGIPLLINYAKLFGRLLKKEFFGVIVPKYIVYITIIK